MYPDWNTLSLHDTLPISVRERLAVVQDEQQGAEDVEDPGEVLDEGRAHGDERAAQDERDHDADHQHLLLGHPRNGETGHHDEEDEEVDRKSTRLNYSH